MSVFRADSPSENEIIGRWVLRAGFGYKEARERAYYGAGGRELPGSCRKHLEAPALEHRPPAGLLLGARTAAPGARVHREWNPPGDAPQCRRRQRQRQGASLECPDEGGSRHGQGSGVSDGLSHPQMLFKPAVDRFWRPFLQVSARSMRAAGCAQEREICEHTARRGAQSLLIRLRIGFTDPHHRETGKVSGLRCLIKDWTEPLLFFYFL